MMLCCPDPSGVRPVLISNSSNLACPIDGEPLVFHEKQLVCKNGHSFDVARQGYVNLLPVQHKRSKEPGDSKEMVIARTEFLNSGFYAPVAIKLTEILSTQLLNNLPDQQEICLLDAGCGEGYYLDFIYNKLEINNKKFNHENNTFSWIGLDISKPAIVSAAKRNNKISWIVGSNRQPPVLKNSVDIILCVFGFQHYPGFRKILKTGGRIILVEPGEGHLKELREIIYHDQKITDVPDSSLAEENGFQVVDSQPLLYKTKINNNEQIKNLLLMTPHFYRANKTGREVALKLQEIEITVDMVFSVLENK